MSTIYVFPTLKAYFFAMKLKLAFVGFLLGLNLLSDAQQMSSTAIDTLFIQRPEVYIQLTLPVGMTPSEISKLVSVDHGQQGNTIKAYANKKEIQNLVDLNIPFTVLNHPSVSRNLPMLQGNATRQQLRSFTAYPTYSQYEGYMQQFAIDHPSICRYVELGTLPSGRKIMAVKISDNPDTRENEPQFLYTSTMHGDETTGYPMLLNLIDEILLGYGSNSRYTNLINSTEIWIVPCANPDGTYAGGNNTVNGATRANANGVDLNRNYPDPQTGLHPDGNAYQPETVIFMGLADTVDFVMAANFHGGAEVVNYPWDTWNHVHPDLNWWQRESYKFADTSQVNSPAGYMDDLYSGSHPGVTNGFAWYEVDGGRQDYMNWWKHCREFTVELSTVKTVAANQLLNHYNYNKASLLNYWEESLHGIRGVITDACTGAPIKAKVFISGHDADSSHVYSSLPVGNYHRPIYQGNYNVTFSAPGYQSQTINNIAVTFNNATVVNVQLQPLAPNAAFTNELISSCGGTVQFSDLTGSASTWSWDFGDGSTSTDQNPLHDYANSGTYTVSLTVTNCAGNDVLTLPAAVSVTIASLPTASDVTASNCNPQSVVLSGSGNGTLQWYDSPVSTNVLASGNSYTTPVLSGNTSYWVSDLSLNPSQYVGPADNTYGAGGYFTGTTYHYLIFDAATDFELVSVWVNAQTSGNRTIQLRNSAGTVLQQSVVNIPAGQGRINLNFQVPAGSGYQLGVGGGSNLYRNSSGSVYPYSIANVVNIIGNSANNLAYYYYFYDWEIATQCESGRLEVQVVFPGNLNADVSITSPDLSVCEGQTVQFNPSPVNGGANPSYQWLVNGNVVSSGNSFSSTTLNDGDEISCVMTSSDACVVNSPVSSSGAFVTIFTSPTTPSVTQSGNLLISSSATGNQWYLNGNLLPGETNDTLVAVTDGDYSVEVTDGNACTSGLSVAFSYQNSNTGLTEQSLNFMIYPNPSEDFVMVKWNSGGNVQLQIFDAKGSLVTSETLQGGNAAVDITGLAPGIYECRLTSVQGVGHQKLIRK